jgi:hypothetical protein
MLIADLVGLSPPLHVPGYQVHIGPLELVDRSDAVSGLVRQDQHQLEGGAELIRDSEHCLVLIRRHDGPPGRALHLVAKSLERIPVEPSGADRPIEDRLQQLHVLLDPAMPDGLSFPFLAPLISPPAPFVDVPRGVSMGHLGYDASGAEYLQDQATAPYVMPLGVHPLGRGDLTQIVVKELGEGGPFRDSRFGATEAGGQFIGLALRLLPVTVTQSRPCLQAAVLVLQVQPA